MDTGPLFKDSVSECYSEFHFNSVYIGCFDGLVRLRNWDFKVQFRVVVWMIQFDVRNYVSHGLKLIIVWGTFYKACLVL